MSISKIAKFVFALIAVFGLAEIAGVLSGSDKQGLISEAQAIVGRPLTPAAPLHYPSHP